MLEGISGCFANIVQPHFQEKRETEKNMEIMWQVLRDCTEGVGFLELVMNMQSFAQFCENCFILSFLVSVFAGILCQKGGPQIATPTSCSSAL